MLHSHDSVTHGASPTEAAATQYLSFSIGGEEYAIEIRHVREIKVWSETTRLPNTPDYVRGVMNLRGAIVPIFDLNAPFHGAPTHVTAKHVVVILGMGEDTIGLLVEAVSDIMDTVAGEIKPVPHHETNAQNSFLSGLITRDKHMVVLLAIDKIFDLTRAGMVAHITESH